MSQIQDSRLSSILYNPNSEKLLGFHRDCTPVYFSDSFSQIIHLQGIPLGPKIREDIPELRGRVVIYPPASISSKEDDNKEYALFKKAVEEWFNYRLEAEGYKYIQQ